MKPSCLRTMHFGVALLTVLAAFSLPCQGTQAQTAQAYAVLFTSPTCTFCQEIVHQQLPPLLQPFGDRLHILYVNVETEAGNRLYQAALSALQIPRGIPLVFIGEDWLMGVAIPERFPALVEHYLAQGGADWPSIPGLEDYLAMEALSSTPSPTPEVVTLSPSPTPKPAVLQGAPVARAVLFWMATCPHCHEVLEHVLPPLQAQYGERLAVWLIELRSNAEVELLYQTAERYGLQTERVGVPFLVIGEHILIGAPQIPQQLPSLIEDYLAQEGVDWPVGLTPPPEAVFFSLPGVNQPATTAVLPAPPSNTTPSPARPGGFGLAMAVLIGMVIAWLYSLSAIAFGKVFHRPAWTNRIIPFCLAAGFLVAGYLSYVEIRMTEAICGPVGDCNAVQASPYARLFGVLPVGVFGLAGYLILLATWLAPRFLPRLRSIATSAFFALALFGVTFSIYLTYLEIFVIRAICLWCLASAVTMTALLLLGLHPATQAGPAKKPPLPTKRKVLFLCTGNSCRSQMAEAIVNARFGESWQAFSAGTRPAGYVHPKAIAALAEIGIRHNGHSKPVDEFRGTDFDLVITVCDSAAEECPLWLGKGKSIHHGYPDPAKSDEMDDFRRVRDAMLQELPALLKQETP